MIVLHILKPNHMLAKPWYCRHGVGYVMPWGPKRLFTISLLCGRDVCNSADKFFVGTITYQYRLLNFPYLKRCFPLQFIYLFFVLFLPSSEVISLASWTCIRATGPSLPAASNVQTRCRCVAVIYWCIGYTLSLLSYKTTQAPIFDVLTLILIMF